MSKLIMLSGLPASGKSTKAKEIVGTGNYVRVNRDLLRTMLHFDKFSGRNEGMTVEAEKRIATLALANGLNVVVDDTNLNLKNKEMWSSIAQSSEASFEHINIDTDWETCVSRDSTREKAVGRSVIVNMALQYGLVPKPKKGYVICDLDGTLCDVEHRRHHVQGVTKDWLAFFSEMANDPVRIEVARMVAEYYTQGYDIIYVSARPEQYRQITENWLKFNTLNLNFSLIMRRANDTRQDTEVKQEILNTYFPDKSSIFKVIDDRPSVIRMWRSNGLDVVDVGKGEEF